LVELLRLRVPGITGILLNHNKRNTNVILGRTCTLLWGSETISDILCGLRFDISPLSFYQVNRSQAELLYEKAAEYAALTGKEKLLDLYCGAGTIGLSMAKQAGSLIGVEIIPEAVENARENARKNGIENAEFLCADAAEAAELLVTRGEKPDVVILDPPRKGCTPELLASVAKMSPERVVYVSCDPATLARDLRGFRELGYSPKEITPCNLFPCTAHVECVCLLTKNK
ncbi:MAG: 23S rRNA (uracil(1939)-C(5))-methyltransferase RlmD, partial [Oscillospiraceae bacterium]